MIRKPPAAWAQPVDDGAVRTVRTASAAVKTTYGAAQRGGKALMGLACYVFAAIWGFAALASGLAGSFPSLIGIGAMSALMFWAGRRSFAKARAA